MYETYVPIPETVVERRPPTIAEIVRQKTDDGARIIDFFLDLMEGRVEDAQLCHRIDSAKQLVKYGYKKAADFIAEHGDEPCDHCESRKRGPRPRKDQGPATGPLQSSPLHVQGPYGYDFLTMLTEDFLTVLSAVDEDLMIKLLRAQTRDGGTVIDFLDNVMHGREDGFKVNHRIAAGRELISHILRDEHVIARTVLEVVADPRVRPLPASQIPSPSTLTPSPSTGEGWGEGDSPARGSVGAVSKPALPGAPWQLRNSPTVVRADARRNPGNTIVVPAKAGTQRGGEGRSDLSKEPAPTTATVVPAEAGTQRGGEGRPEPVEGPVPNTTEEPRIVRPELVEEPVLSLSKEQCSGDSAVPGPAANGALTPTEEPAEATPSVVPAKARAEGSELPSLPQLTTNNQQLETSSRPRRRTRTQSRREGNARAAMHRKAQGPGHNNKKEDEKPAPAELTPAERRISERLDAYWHDPDPYGAPIDSTTPGRSPPW